ncbi:Putative TPP-binding enzyme; Possible Sulfopyruvate decarboxylase subunit beta/Phosphonopyruvate decarboxylase-like enzyme (plasmid) [Pseudorhizobium banfieldiae]|uniref:Putative TPP-binding enzyme Possible Sulfopyruvate decarboxylase subunit beta/Phosphonopyruvate decarboxylase-like enzyme n=1 Tax=Pseudorhizobium banfieldiae TaxID=1125847 RepID=L0NN62_9HYPH|nr:thiamine pyrophosphate-dependent enzyme [Pseudorhizobium banfieldiae]CAD6628954.1 thiamine pyrophosphate enzyme-like protein [arsenite-oxidising bacterium NT-25]CCF22261.1 Putative TPP-binding enzyme; Possible Sulfopyruvate decarboxylase subunit beta/Phosphonopyruvate decarboxylase-like enzyme [Pseudorhizobium banfieldiae]
MKCEQAVRAVIEYVGEGILVPTMSAIKWVDTLAPETLRVSCVPLMGGASALGLGLALSQPKRSVIVLDGDGSLQMQLGSLVTCVENAPKNFIHIVFNNGVWFENMVNLDVPGSADVRYSEMAQAAGYKSTHHFADHEAFRKALPDLLVAPGPHFVELKIEPACGNLWGAENLQPDLPDYHFARMGVEAEKLRGTLAAAPN